MVEVSWDDAVAFAEWLTQQEGREYRLPTEAEWEYACRAGTRTRFWWGDADADGWKYANANDPKTKEEFGSTGRRRRTTGTRDGAVGSYPPNAWGLYDVHGNVWEWCGDWYGDVPTGRVTDPSGPRDGTSRVVRGGSWHSRPGHVRSADRGRIVPADPGGVHFGLRLVSPVPARR